MKVVFFEKIKVIDGKVINREIKHRFHYCCDQLLQSDYNIQPDKKFGMPTYDEWGDSLPTEEIKICPFCGEKLECIELKPVVKKGRRVWDIKKTKGVMITKTNPRYEFDDGSVETLEGRVHTSKIRTFVIK